MIYIVWNWFIEWKCKVVIEEWLGYWYCQKDYALIVQLKLNKNWFLCY